MIHSVDLFEPWLEFNTPIVRQLAFCIASPNIIASIPAELPIKFAFHLHDASFWQNCYVNYSARLKALDKNPEALIHFFTQIKSTRLGIRFETLLWFWLQDNPNQQYHPYQLLRHSLQKIDGAKTLGELDFLLFNTDTQQVEHWEVALKFYLAEQQYQLKAWYGLNRDDTLNKKLQHFTQKQFQFDHALEHTIQQKFAVLKGQLYLPIETSYAIPHWVNCARRLGRWGHHIPTFPMYHLSRHEWICPNAKTHSSASLWWRNDLYCNQSLDFFYMFRQPSPIYLAKTIK
ncbi:DUF1853 family protein [Acinetobacter sp. MD2(2019)]|uniref:DUF1853 family protein n=1 Tax=Acinetobacter sp. MD2(2019) TaxID=2605273 RepID=UPI002D1F6F85|nr:DUF1853 family protein [Acinetobacter sp. MD2(2019)]MEB3754856.1 DUF1853 family protein [Acinetobacter sp. MD2(2019)]